MVVEGEGGIRYVGQCLCHHRRGLCCTHSSTSRLAASSSLTEHVKAVIANLGYAYPLGYEPGHLGIREKKKIE